MLAKVRTFKAEAGISFEYKGMWHKFHTGIELEIEPQDNIADVKRKAWNTVEHELANQIDKTLKDRGREGLVW